MKKLEKQVSECEQEIAQTEAAITLLEKQMSTPEGAADMSLYEKHQKFKMQLDKVMKQWEGFAEELELINS